MDVFSKAGLFPKKHHRCISLESGQSSTKKSCLQKTPSDPPRFFPRRYSTPELAMRRHALRHQQRDDDVPPGQPISNKSCQTDILGLDKYLQRPAGNASSQNESDAVSSETTGAALRAYKKPSKRPKVRSVAVHCERRRLSFAAFKGCQKFKHVYKRKISLPQPSSATTSTDDGRRRDSSVLPKLWPDRTAETERPMAANKVSVAVKLPKIPTRDARPEAERPDDGGGIRTRLDRLTRPQSTGSSGDGSGDRKLAAAYFRAKSAPKIYSPRFHATAPLPSDRKPLQSTPGTSDTADTTLDMAFGRRQPVDATSTMTATAASGTRTVSTSTSFTEPGFPIVFSCESVLRHPLDGGYVSHTESHRFSVHYVSADSARSSVTATSDTDRDTGPSLVFTSAGACQNERCLTGESVSVTLGGKPNGPAASTSTTSVAGERRLVVERCPDVRRSKDDMVADRGTGDTATDRSTIEMATNQGNIKTATNQGNIETATDRRTSGTDTNQGTIETVTNQGNIETATDRRTSETATNHQTCETATDSGTCEMTATDDDDQTASEPPLSPPSPPSTSSSSSTSSVRYCWPVGENRNSATNIVTDVGAEKLGNGQHDTVFYVSRKDDGANAFEKPAPPTAVNKTIDTLGEARRGEEGNELELHARTDDDDDDMPLQSDERNYEQLTQNHQIIESSRTVSNQSPKLDDTESVLVGRQNDLGPIESDNTHANIAEPISAEHRGTTNAETTATEQHRSIVNNLLTVPSNRRLQSDEDTAAAEIMASRRRNEMQRSESSGRRVVAGSVERNHRGGQRENGQTVQSNANKRNMPNRLDDNMSRKRDDSRDADPRHLGNRLLQGSSSGATPAQHSNAVGRGSAAANATETTALPRNAVNDHPQHGYEPFGKRTNGPQDGGRRCVRERDVTNDCRGCANGDVKNNVAGRSEVYGTDGHDRSYDAGKNRHQESKRRLESVDEATETSKQQHQQESNYVGGCLFGDSFNRNKKPPQRYGEHAEYGRGYYDNDPRKVNFSSKPDYRYDYYRSEHAPKTGGHSPRDEDCTVFADRGSHQGSTAQLPYYSHLDCKRTYGGGGDRKCTADITDDDDDDDDDDDESLTDSLEDGCKYEGTAVSYFLALDGQKSAVTFTLKMPGTLESRLNRRQSLLKKHLHVSTTVRKSTAAVRVRSRHKGCQTLWTVEKGVQVQRGSTANMDDRRALETLLAGLGRNHVSENQIRLVGGRKMVSEGNQTEHPPANRHTQTTRDVAAGRETPECCAAAGRQSKNQMLAMKKFSTDNALMVGVVRQNKYCKGKEALDGVKNDQLLTLSKGWINFYTLRADSADAEAQVEFNDNDDEVKAEDDSQQYTVHVQAIPEPAVTLPVVHVPHRNNNLQLPKTSSTTTKHLPKLVQTETNNNHHCPTHLAAANGWCVSVDGPNNMHMKVSLLPDKAGIKTSEHFDLNDENKLDARRLALQRKTNYMRKPYRNMKRTQSTPRDMFSADVSRTESALSAESKYIETIDTQLLIHKARRRLSQEWDTRIQNRGLTESVQLVVTGDSVSSRTSQHYATRGHQHCSFRRQSRRI
ncbi:uncharacterized protein LOC132940493 isoform X1 [Metopolophium dirhodum]|uniref:uncharacterized protein LOC132940493 isoform X1 n=1 Tax=Metopolophium dirhodum TaxID=44670 RepID=UPI00298FB25A|nr:uncharacterized protein LOC132940493 isoform X1 [Metopolophium dirhodum]XP_060864120.1 uncharacterized protein LOC132940493 isoform X1 [Metopolophium dirhodum]XP_060864121.1 uncharacterized protein LOC132940493 isoform X1 [Metopolophium dirhodum]XP_060864122.1 uncharacterized protein LOC132940493 isoform X1 [Metopolophium dirhodum]